MNDFIKMFGELLGKTSTYVLSMIIVCAGLGAPLLSLLVIEVAYKGNEPPVWLLGAGSLLMFFAWGWLGVLWMIRGETMLRKRVSGKSAWLMGFVTVMLTWGVALFLLWGAMLSSH